MATDSLIKGIYQTPSKRSPIWNDGSQFFEGEFNRAIVNGIIQELVRLKIPFVNVAPEYRDVILRTRVNRANFYGSRNLFYCSFKRRWRKGSEIYTSVGNTKSDRIATIFGKEYKKEFPNKPLRSDFSDGDLDKERHFYVLTKAKMPAILTENFFMDNEDECKNIIMTKEGCEKIITYHINAIIRVKNELFIK